DLVLEEDATSKLREEAAEVLDRAIEVLSGLEDFSADSQQTALRAVLGEEMGIKPRHAFTPLRVGVTGRRVSPPALESLEMLGRSSSIARLRRLRERL